MKQEKSPITVLDKLKEQYPDSSKNTMKQWVLDGRVYLNKRRVLRIDAHVKENDQISLEGQKTKHQEGISIVYEDPSIVVVNKPSGLLSVASKFETKQTVHAILKRKYPHKKIFVIHRLDFETSGLMVFALTYSAFQFLKDELAQRKVKRVYEGIVEGSLQGKGTWSCYLKEDEVYYVRASDDPKEGELAITHFESLKATSSFSHLRFTLQTGKKNQIRVQAAKSGHPITGDDKYGALHSPLKRIALHAALLSFTHPETKKKLTFTSPIPPEWMRYCKKNTT
jgi:23S rRNA pseudouridine1911/1915/1917 synthase